MDNFCYISSKLRSLVSKRGKLFYTAQVERSFERGVENKMNSPRALGSSRLRMLAMGFALVMVSAGSAPAQTIFDWLDTAPDNNWKQGAGGARWNPGGLWDQPGFGVLRFYNNHQLNMNNNVAGTYSMHGLILGGTSGVRTISGNTLRLFDSGGTDPYIANDSSITHVLNLPIEGDGDAVDPLIIRINNAGGLTFSNTINNQGGSINVEGSTSSSATVTFNGVISGGGGLFKNNANTTVVLAANNSFSGQVTHEGGTISITNNNSLGTGRMRLGNANVSTRFLVNSNTTRSTVTALNSGASNVVIEVPSNVIFTQSGALEHDNGTANTTKFGKAGAGTLVLSGTGSTYNGQMQIGEGTVIIGQSGSFGVNTSTSQRGIDLGLNVSDTSQGNAVAVLASNGVTISNSFYIAPNTSSAARTIGLAGNGTNTFSAEFFMDGTLTVDAGSSATSLVNISGSLVNSNGGIIKTNAGILTLSASNSFTNGVNLAQGTLRINNAWALGATASRFTVSGASTIDNTTAGAITLSNNNPQTWNADFTFTGTQSLNLGTGAVTLGATRQVTVSANTLTIGGIIGDGGSARGLTKAGNGTLVLGGANTYTGTNTINAGILQINGNDRIANGSAVTLAGGTLQASGTVSDSMGALNVTTSSTIDMGAGTANLTFASLTGVTGTLSITNFNGSDSVAFTSTSNVTEVNLANITVNGAVSGSSGSNIIAATAAGAPTSLAVSPGIGTLTATFGAPSTTGGRAITNYEYSINGGTNWTAVSPVSTNTTITISSGVSNGSTYNVQVRAVTAFGGGTATATVQGTPRTTPTVTTAAATNVDTTTATLGGNITDTGGNNSTLRGVEYSTTNNFTQGTGTQASASGSFSTGAFTNNVSGLNSSTVYYYRGFASNAAGISYGTLTNFTTLAATAVISASTNTIAAFSTTYGTNSSSTSFTVSGANMATNILVTPPSGFEVSTNGTTFSSTVTVGAAGTIANTTVHVRLAASTVPGTYSGNIVLSSSGAANVNVATTLSTVSEKALTVTSAAVTTKTYDGTNTATITGTLSGVVGSDAVTLVGTGTFNNATVGTGKAVTSTSTLGGTHAARYTLTQPTGLTGTITALGITGSFTASSKTYDGTNSATVATRAVAGKIGSDDVNHTGGTATFDSATVGTNKTVTLTGATLTGAAATNYSLLSVSNTTANITALAITGSFTANNKVYDGTTTATVATRAVSGKIGSDDVNHTGGTATFNNATVGTNKTVTLTGATLTGTAATNYTLSSVSNATADITKATPTVTTAPTASTIYYAQALSASTLSGGTVSPSGGTWAWTTPATVATPGAATYSATYTPTDTTNYNTATTNVSLTSTMAQARNTAGSATPGAPSSIYLGDTNRTFTSETWGTINGTNGSARLVIRYNNADLSGGVSQGFATADSNDTNTLTSLQFTNTGTWYWGVQMNYGSPFGSNFWYKVSTNTWTAMSTNGVDATLNVTVLALPNPSSVAFSSTGTNQTTIGWTAATAGGSTYQTLVVRHSSSNITDLTQGTSYTTNGDTGAGTVVYKGFATNFTDTGLSPSTSYFYKVYAENWNYYSSGTATNVTTTGLPTLTIGGATNATATAFTNTYGTASATQTFSIAGSNLTNNITATAPTGFELSTNGASGWTNALSFTQSGGSASGTLHVRLSTNATASTTAYNSQNISLTSSGLTRSIATASSGNTVSKKVLTVTAGNQSVVFGTTVARVQSDATVSYSGFVNGDTSSVITGTPTYTTTYTAATAAGTDGVTITPVTTGLSATNYSFAPADGAITVTALGNPTGLTVSKNSSLPMTSVNLSWAKADNRDVLIVRNTSDTWTEPTVGMQYVAGNTIGSGVVVYESGGTSTTDNGLTPGATYYYRFYSENYLSYSTGTTGSSVTLDAVQARNAGGAATPSVALTNGTTNTIYVGDQARFSFDATGTIPSSTATNWGQPQLRLKFNDADLSTGFIGTTNTANGGFTDLTNKTIIATNRFTSSGTWYWAMQMSYGSTYGSAFWYKASSANFTNMASDGTGSSLSFAVTALPDPTGVTVTSPSPTTNTVSFTRTGRSGGEFAAFIVRKANSAVDWTPTAGTTYSNGFTTNGNVVVDAANFSTSVSDTGLTAGTAYHYKVFSENWGYYSAGATATVTTVPSAPAAPTSSAVTASNFTATWVNPGGATNYFLDVSGASNFATFVSGYSNKAVATTSDSIAGLSANTTYYVRVRAQSSGGTSSNSPTLTQLTAPAAPAEPTAATVLATSFTVNWTAVTGASSYRLDVATDSGFTSFVSGFENKTLSALTDSLSGLTAGTTYYLRVRAVNAGGTGANSPTLTVATAASATAPSISDITAGNGTLSVAFTAGESGGNTISNYQYSTDNGSNFTAVSPASTNSPILITGLSNGTSYTVQIRALNSDDTTGSASAGVSSTPRTVPGAPTSLTVTPGNTQLTASFTAPADNGGSAITNYEYSLNGGTSFTAVSPASTSTSITITGLTNGTAYNVQVRAVNVAGSGAAADSVSGTPRTTPSVTTGAASSVAAYSAALAGNITNTGGNNPSMRGVEYSTNSGFTTGTGTQASSSGDFGTGVFTNSATNLASGSTYYYRAFASNSAGISYGTQSNFTTLTVPGGKDPDTANATTAFLGDTVSLSINSWKTFNSTARSFGTVFGRFGNADLTTGTSQSSTNGVSPSLDQFSVNTSRLTNTGTFYWTIRVSWGSGNDYWFDGPRAGWSDLGLTAPTNSPLSIEVSALNNPTSVTATNTSTSQINLTWAKGVSGNAKNTMIVRSTDTNFTAPAQGTAYTVGNTALGGDTVIYNDGGTNYGDTNLTAGTTYYYRLYAENWSYYSSGADASAATAGTPTITISGLTNNVTTAEFTTTYGTPSAAQNFTIGGANLTTNITAAAPTGFQVSTNDSVYTNAVIFTQSGGTAGGTLYLRLSASANAGNYNSASVTLSSTGATNRTITTPATGNTVSKATPEISLMPSVSSSVMVGDTLSNGLLSGGTASVGGTFGFGDLTNRQTATGSKAVTFTPTDTTNFASVSTNVSVTVDPIPDPTSVTATNGGSTNSIGLTHTRSSNRNVMIVRRAGSAVTFAPSDGTGYSDGQNVGDGQTVVNGSLAGDTSTDSSLAASTTYHYKIFSENWGYYSAGVTANATTASPNPSVSVSGTPAVMSANYGVASTASQFTVSGANLTASMNVAAPAGFEVSTASGSGFASSVTLTPTSGTVASTTIYVRLKSNATPGANSGNVTVASTGASSQTVAVSGTVNVASMTMTINSSAGSMNADYTTSKLFADELADTTNNLSVTFNPGVSPDEVEVWTNLNNRDRADNDANTDGIPDGIIPPDPPTDKPEGYVSGVYPTSGYFQAHPMSGSSGTYTLTINANKTGAYRLTARYRMNGGPWVYYNYGGKRDHAITVTPVLARNMNVYEINTLNVNATGSTFETRSTFESLTNSANGRVNLDYLRNMGVNTLWFQPVHPNGVEGREAPGGTPYDPGSPYAVKNFFEVMEQMSQGNTRAASMTAFANFVAAADTKGVNVMLDAPFNHTAYDCELDEEGLALMAAAGVNTTGWSATDAIKGREARFYSKNDSGSQYSGPASSAGNVAAAPDRNDFGKWNDVIDVYFGRYSSLVTGNPTSGAALNKYKNEEDAMTFDDLRGGSNTAGAVTRAVWQYFARYVPYWLEKTGLPEGSSLADQATKGVDGLRADFGQGMPPQFWEYVINVARERKWSFVFMSESLDGGEVTYRSNRHFDILNENIVFPWQNAANTTAHRTIFEDRRAAYGQGLVLLNNTSHDEAGYADPWQAFIRYAVGSTVDGSPMIMYGQEIGTGASLSFDNYEVNFGKSIPHFKRWNSMNPQWTAWGNNSLGVKNLMPNYSGVGLAREFSRALRSSNRWFLNPIGSGTADPDIFAVAKYETANASPSTSDVVLAFVNLNRNSAEANTFGIPAGLGTALGIEANKYYNVKNIAAYLGPNNEYPNRRSQFLWETPRLGSDILQNGIYVSMNAVPGTDGGWTNAPYEAQYLKLYAAPSISTSGTPTAVTNTFNSNSPTTSFTLSGSDIHDGMTISAPNGFQVSTNESSGFANSITLTNTGTISSLTIYTRLNGTNDVGSYTGSVTLSSPGGLNTSVSLPSSSVTAAPLPATTFAQNQNGSFTATASGITSWNYTYTGRTNGVSGFNTNYAFMTWSNSSNPVSPGFYRVTARPTGRAATNFTGSAFEDYAIAGPLLRDINTTRTAGAVTNNLLRTTLMAAVQRVTTNSTLSTGTNGLTWTNPIAGFSFMANGASNPNSVSYISASTIRLFVTNTNSISDTLTVVVSDGFTPVTFPVTVTPTNGAVTNVPSLTTTAVSNSSTTFTNTGGTVVTNAPADAVMTNATRMMSFMARPNRPIVIQFRHPADNQWYHVTATNLPFVSAGNQPRTNGTTVTPVIFTPRTGVIRFLADTNLSGWQARPAQ